MTKIQKDNKNVAKFPNLRFPPFTEEWETKKLGEIAKKIGDGLHGTPIYVDESDFYFINGNNLVNGKIELNENTKKIDAETSLKNDKQLRENTLLISINGTIGNIAKYNNENVMLGKSVGYFNFDENSDFLYFVLQTKLIQNFFNSEQTGSTIKNLSLKTLRETLISRPNQHEQQKIATFLSLVDERIQTQNKIIEQLETLIKGICQNLAINKHWEKQYLRNILTERKETNKDNLPIFSVSVSKGIINQIEYLGRSFASKNTTNYNVVYFGDIVYTKSPTGEFPYGIIKQSFIRENVAVSPLYGVYIPKNINIGSILHYYFNSPVNANNYLHSLVQKGAKNTINITNQRFMDNAIYLPTDEKEIVKIASLLSAINKKNQTEKAVLTQFKNQKKYLLKQMFV